MTMAVNMWHMCQNVAPYFTKYRRTQYEDKIHALFQNLMKPSLQSSSAIYDYVKVATTTG
jgi:hypothetical protein